MSASLPSAYTRVFSDLAALLLLRNDAATANDETLLRAGEQVLLAGLGQTRSLGQDAELLTLMVAMTLSPRDAIAYSPSSPIPRWRVIFDHLNGSLTLLTPDELSNVSRRIAVVLDNWDEGRDSRFVTSMHRLLQKAERRCTICRIPFFGEAVSVSTRDDFKPMYEAPEELARPEVDHIVSLALSGTNLPSNFQILCRACNAAKGSGLDISPFAEIRYAAASLKDMPRLHRFRMLQWVVTRVEPRCRGCGNDKEEMTVRLRGEGLTYMRLNLESWCYPCLLTV